MAKYPGLVKRGKRGTYWFRRRNPTHLTPQAGAEINVSLRTRDLDTAVERWAVEDAKARRLFGDGAKPRAAVSQVEEDHAAIIATFDECLRHEEHAYRLARSLKEAEKSSPKWFALAETYRERQRILIAEAKARAVTLFLVPYDDWLSKHYPNLELGDSDELHVALVRTEIRVREALLANDDSLLPPAPPQKKITTTTNDAPFLSAIVTDYIDRRGSGLSDERSDTIRATARDLINVIGDKSVTAYHAADASAFEAVMLSLPANWTKKRALRNLTITKAADKAKALGLPRQSAKNIRKKWSVLFSLFKQAAIKYPMQNPFVAEALIVSDNTPANEKKNPFRPDELRALLASDLPGPLHWLTWLGLFTGARLNELCQLSTPLIRKHGPIHYIFFSPALRLKTGEGMSCVRSVPIQSRLIEQGFLDYVSKCEGSLFPGLRRARTGRYSDAQSKAFTRHLNEMGIKRRKLSYHSLRHTFAARFKTSAPRDVETRERLLGHVVKGVAGIYGDDYEAEANDMDLLMQRWAVLEKVRFL